MLLPLLAGLPTRMATRPDRTVLLPNHFDELASGSDDVVRLEGYAWQVMRCKLCVA